MQPPAGARLASPRRTWGWQCRRLRPQLEPWQRRLLQLQLPRSHLPPGGRVRCLLREPPARRTGAALRAGPSSEPGSGAEPRRGQGAGRSLAGGAKGARGPGSLSLEPGSGAGAGLAAAPRKPQDGRCRLCLPQPGRDRAAPSTSASIVSLISLAVLSYERYRTLTLCNKRGSDYQKALLAVGGSWLYSLIWTVPPLIGWSSYGLEGAGTSCSVRWTSESADSVSYIVCLFIFCLVIPVTVMIYCYGSLLYAVKQVGKIRKNAARKREYHVLFMVITTVICYLICWMPYGVIALIATFGSPGAVSPIAYVIPSILAKSSTVCNPIIYILMNKQVQTIQMCCESYWDDNYKGMQ
ncbi:vertebrate ancient opsin-like isoform X3 [Pelodiscus sinensis]|uniref:vertebrate ancient opsin-like isoform X3 n=1 Tax=Pelodiscus sinensis TaxID=13735 RepID=UPI003F6C24A0